MSVTLVADPKIPGFILTLIVLAAEPSLRFLCSINGFDELFQVPLVLDHFRLLFPVL